jgi:RES domain-containing protein
VDAKYLDDLAEIEGATNGRLMAQERGTDRIGAREFVAALPHAAFINAAFAYWRPRELNRFNGPGRGAWYAALAVETCIAEVSFHMVRELARIDDSKATVDYAELIAAFAGEFVDLRDVLPRPACLNPDPARGYPAGNRLADETIAAGRNGIVYPSVRHPGGTCLVALWPHVVQSVRQGGVIRLRWAGAAQPIVEFPPASDDVSSGEDVGP